MVQDTIANACRGTGYGLEEDFSSSLSLPFSDAIGSLQVHILGPYLYFFYFTVIVMLTLGLEVYALEGFGGV
jgi:hypothetical protein